MANAEHLAILKQGVDQWNTWRKANPKVTPNLSNADLSRANLRGANLSFADLEQASLREADLTNARLSLANLTGARLVHSIVDHADFRGANLSKAFVLELQYSRRGMHGKYLGIHGLESCYGDAIFKRDAQDQDFIDALERKWQGSWRMAFYWLWWATDFGRSLGRVAVFALLLSGAFGGLYAWDDSMLHYPDHKTFFTPVYYSIVTYTTLGFGDVTPRTVRGELFVTLEVIIGYLTLGLLISILANKVARRS